MVGLRGNERNHFRPFVNNFKFGWFAPWGAKEQRNRATIKASRVNIVVKPNALELVSSCPSLRINLFGRTHSVCAFGQSRDCCYPARSLSLSLQLPEFVPILRNVWFFMVVIQAQPWLRSSLLSSRSMQSDVQPVMVAINCYFYSGRKQHLNY